MISHLMRFLSSSSDEANEDQAFNVAIATIFAREVLEGCIIIGQYRTAVIKHSHMDEDMKKDRLRAITWSASLAGLLAVVVVLAVAIPLGILSSELDEKVVEIIEGVSKVVAAIFILQLSVKMPEYLGLYRKVSLLPWKKFNPEKERAREVDITIKEIRFNVAWNIWREVAECGVFLIPFFLGTGAKAIPLSGLVGIAISLILGIGIYVANNSMKNKLWLAWVMAGLTLFLSVGLFVGGCHEFEEVWGETPKVYVIENPNMSHKTLPMAILKPFGYSSSRTVLQITCFWCWLALGCGLHFYKWRKSVNVNRLYPRGSILPPVEGDTAVSKQLQSEGSSEENDPTSHLSTQKSGDIADDGSGSGSGDVENPSTVPEESTDAAAHDAQKSGDVEVAC
mmetsp:Transcript_49803/g.120705  ORF Transcript_49803/g.120705 Transcript_49803/m.120705 type:complete len:395 (+) Transcript_49803:336-1520(+)|eukprot:CAMPEP_0113464622 /NCGR_PEP_ID=MMETSP0014_2-20120614/13297_1 /TAXON_ID=2857 /ORGANISM="Nitzschia sp." /LENGTH=394 /DNA_ID=CAMNT_0000356711 /DNA_START=181 /DNA_END=1365 /DNA_ORIENTATION=+ /assembly_acc=CAM_ASM_000159